MNKSLKIVIAVLSAGNFASTLLMTYLFTLFKLSPNGLTLIGEPNTMILTLELGFWLTLTSLSLMVGGLVYFRPQKISIKTR